MPAWGWCMLSPMAPVQGRVQNPFVTEAAGEVSQSSEEKGIQQEWTERDWPGEVGTDSCHYV
jgi:hypothetical protein